MESVFIRVLGLFGVGTQDGVLILTFIMPFILWILAAQWRFSLLFSSYLLCGECIPVVTMANTGEPPWP